jgi:hypothetical protein
LIDFTNIYIQSYPEEKQQPTKKIEKEEDEQYGVRVNITFWSVNKFL